MEEYNAKPPLRKYKLADLEDQYIKIYSEFSIKTYLIVPINDTEGVGIFIKSWIGDVYNQFGEKE